MSDKNAVAKKLLTENRLSDLYKLSRFAYRVNNPIISDSIYDSLEKIIKRDNLSELVNQTYDDDPIPRDLLEEFNLEHLVYDSKDITESSEFYNYLDSEKSNSIRAIDNYQDVFGYLNSIEGEDFIISPKGNGWNYKGLFLKENEDSDFNRLELYLTRGRSTNGIVVTKNLSRVTPRKIKSPSREVIVYGEGVVDMSAVKSIKRKDGTSFTSARMAAGSMARTGCVDDNDFRHLHYYVFNADNVAPTISETLDILKEQGFEVMPYIILKSSEIPKTLSLFIPWMKSIMDNMFKVIESIDLSADGLVIDVNNKSFSGSQNNQYNTRNCALKFEYWSQLYYKGIIKDILFEQQEVFTSVVIVIEKIVTNDSCEASRISSYNVDYLKALDLGIGDEVYFERNSEAINVILTGEKLKEAKGLIATKSDSVLTNSNSFGEIKND